MSHNPPGPVAMGQTQWRILDHAATDTACTAPEDVDCPAASHGTCKPPPPPYSGCPPAGASKHLVLRRDGTCVWLPSGCATLACAGDQPTGTACPTATPAGT